MPGSGRGRFVRMVVEVGRGAFGPTLSHQGCSQAAVFPACFYGCVFEVLSQCPHLILHNRLTSRPSFSLGKVSADNAHAAAHQAQGFGGRSAQLPGFAHDEVADFMLPEERQGQPLTTVATMTASSPAASPPNIATSKALPPLERCSQACQTRSGFRQILGFWLPSLSDATTASQSSSHAVCSRSMPTSRN